MPIDADLRLMARDVGQDATAIVTRMLPRSRWESESYYLARIRDRWMELMTVMLNTAIDSAVVAECKNEAPIAVSGNTSITPDEMLGAGLIQSK